MRYPYPLYQEDNGTPSSTPFANRDKDYGIFTSATPYGAHCWSSCTSQSIPVGSESEPSSPCSPLSLEDPQVRECKL